MGPAPVVICRCVRALGGGLVARGDYEAADTLVALLQASRQLGASGVVLKDEGAALPPGSG